MGSRVDEVVCMDIALTEEELSAASVRGERKQASDAVPPDGFDIVESEDGSEELRFLPADIATCDSCEQELFDPANRRYRYPFISCVSCGPRFSIMNSVPYDRERTTMAEFDLCGECQADYTRPGDIRRHAQTIACEVCGPEVKLYISYDSVSAGDLKDSGGCDETVVWGDQTGSVRHETVEMGKLQADCTGGAAVDKAIELIRQGRIIAVKDIGGYHFCFDPFCDEAGRQLREFKHRDRKPFAVMFDSIDEIKKYAYVSAKEKELLTSPARPIVLLENKNSDHLPDSSFHDEAVPKKEDNESVSWGESICMNSSRIGAMLPCNPLQLLLLRELKVLVMTSGNRGGEPIITDDEEMLSLMGEGAVDAVLSHDREILNGLDDSIYQVLKIPKNTSEEEGDSGIEISLEEKESSRGNEHIQILRRARGLVPEPVRLPFSLTEDVLAAGGDLKSVFAFGRKNMAYLSGHFGDLEDVQAAAAYRTGIGNLERLLGVHPERAVYDLHPNYLSKKIIQEYSHYSSGDISVQHHCAHIASVMAEHALTGDVLGLAFDGTGYGEDGSVWGSEFLLCGDHGFERAGHFSSIPMIASDDAAKRAELSLYAYLYEAEKRGFLVGGEIEALFELMSGDGKTEGYQKGYDFFRKAVNAGVNTVSSSSMGRLFDAASAALGICYENSYEGECAIMLEQAAEAYTRQLKWELTGDGLAVLSTDMYEPSDIWAPVRTVTSETGSDHGGLRSGHDGTTAKTVADSVFLIAGLVKQRLYGEEAGRLAFMFHQSIADASAEVCRSVRDQHGDITQVALSGGTMCNRILLSLLIPALERDGLDIFINEKVPCGDGGLALGQLWAAHNFVVDNR